MGILSRVDVAAVSREAPSLFMLVLFSFSIFMPLCIYCFVLIFITLLLLNGEGEGGDVRWVRCLLYDVYAFFMACPSIPFHPTE